MSDSPSRDPLGDQRERNPASPGVPRSGDDGVANAATGTTPVRQSSIFREIIETLLLAVLIFIAVRAVVLNFRVDGHSMDPSLANNEMLLVNRNAYLDVNLDDWFSWLPGVEDDGAPGWYPFGTPERGDIVVLTPPATEPSDKPYIKRVIGLPGDEIEVRDPGLFINGTKIDEPYLEGISTWCHRKPYCSVVVPEGSVFVLGDNRNNSSDSRTFGVVPIDNIIGKAWITYWPRDYIGIVPHNDYPELGDGN